MRVHTRLTNLDGKLCSFPYEVAQMIRLSTACWRTAWQANFGCSGHRRRLPDGSCAYPDNEDYHETVYRILFIQARGGLKKKLLEHWRRTWAMCRSRDHMRKTAGFVRRYRAANAPLQLETAR